MAHTKNRRRGSGWNPGKQPPPLPITPVPAHDPSAHRAVVVLTEGAEDESEYHLLDALCAPRAVCIGCLEKEFCAHYGITARAEMEEEGYNIDHYDNMTLHALEEMAAEGYSDDDMRGVVWTHPRRATLFAAWLIREKGFVRANWIEYNEPWAGVMHDSAIQDVRVLRQALVDAGVDPLTPTKDAPADEPYRPPNPYD